MKVIEAFREGKTLPVPLARFWATTLSVPLTSGAGLAVQVTFAHGIVSLPETRSEVARHHGVVSV